MLPITPVAEGSGQVFFRRMQAFANVLPDVFHTLEARGLMAASRGLKKLRFVERLERGSQTRAYYDRSKDTVSVYPMAFAVGQRPDAAVYAGFGFRHWELNVSNEDKLRWRNKLVIPKKNVVDRFVEITRQRAFNSWEDVVKEFHAATERLQVVHIINGLLTSNVKISDLKTVNVQDHPATSDFCKGLRPYSLIPVVSTYVSEHHLENFGDAFSYFVMNTGRFNATETSTEAELVNLFTEVTGARQN